MHTAGIPFRSIDPYARLLNLFFVFTPFFFLNKNNKARVSARGRAGASD